MMTKRLASDCKPASCLASFTVDGQRGHQKLLGPKNVTLFADEPNAEYLWHVDSNPPACDYLLSGATLRQAVLTLPGPGAFVVQLTVTKGECTAQERYIVWVETPRRHYRLPAASEALRFDGDPDWAGDLAKALQQADGSLPTPEQMAAMDKANHPSAGNPFATLEDLNGGSPGPVYPVSELTGQEIAAIKKADDPHGDNPFVTESRLCQVAPTPDEKDALDEAESPRHGNPLVTLTVLQRTAPTPEQRDALNCAENPGVNNAFVTESRLKDEALPTEQRGALNKAWDPSWQNPFVTVSHAQTFAPTSDQRAALEHAHAPDATNHFVTVSHLQDNVPTPDQQAAMGRAMDPRWDNPFVTERRLEDATPTSDQRLAMDRSHCPNAANPFVTVSHMQEFAPTPRQKDALDNAQDPRADNPFVTKGQLPAGEVPPDWPIGVTDAQRQALDAAYQPSSENPFITRDALPPPQLTPDQEAAIDGGDKPGAQNPFVTRDPWLATAPTGPEKRALDAADQPEQGNPFVTQRKWQATAPTSDEKAALDAAHQPSSGNPFITREAMPPPQLTPDQEAAVDGADKPSAANPVVTLGQWLATAPTSDEKAALDAAHQPSSGNPFITREAMPPPQLTSDQEAAVDKADKPSAANPVVTLGQWLATAPTSDEKAALDKADQPGELNPFVTMKQLTGLPPDIIGVTLPQREALDRAHEPSAENHFLTEKDLPFSDGQKQAIQSATDASSNNPFVTESKLPKDAAPEKWPIGVTDRQKQALDAAENPHTGNPFITQTRLTTQLPLGIKPDQWPIGVTQPQRDGLDKAEGDSAHAPSATNAFVTESKLPKDAAPEKWPIGVSEGQKAALDAADEYANAQHRPGRDNPFATRNMCPTQAQDAALDAAEAYPEAKHKPSLLNPFLTQSRWDETAPTVPQKAALDAASAHPLHPPSASNRFATLADLGNGSPTGSCDLDDNLCDAIKAGLDTPSGGNPFVTRDYLPRGKPPRDWPIGLTNTQDAALDAADAYPDEQHRPGLSNPFLTQSRWEATAPTLPEKEALDNTRHTPGKDNPYATLSDLGLVGITTRVVAAGRLDLSLVGAPTTPVLGRLKVVSSMPATGLVTLSFDSYGKTRQDYYVVKALPVRQAALDPQHFTVVQFVEFTDQGFVLHMSQPLVPSTNLGRCMIEVSEIVNAVVPAESELVQAIREYYDLIQKQRYDVAFRMLSDEYKNSHGQTTFVWDVKDSMINLDYGDEGHWAEVMVRLKRGGMVLDEPAMKDTYKHRFWHLSGKGGQLIDWFGIGFGETQGLPNAVDFHVARKDVLETNQHWYRSAIYAGEPPPMAAGKPIALSGEFQLPAKGHRLDITIDLKPVPKPLDEELFRKRWEGTGPARITPPMTVDTSSTPAVCDLRLNYDVTGGSEHIWCTYRKVAGIETSFPYGWRLVDETSLP